MAHKERLCLFVSILQPDHCDTQADRVRSKRLLAPQTTGRSLRLDAVNGFTIGHNR